MASRGGGKGRGSGNGRGGGGAGAGANSGGAGGRGRGPWNMPGVSDENEKRSIVSSEDAGIADMGSLTSEISTLSVNGNATSSLQGAVGGGDMATKTVFKGKVMMAQKPAKPGSLMRPGTQRIKVMTNMLEAVLPASTTMWQYHITITKGTGKTQRILSKGGGDDYTRYIKREKCWYVFTQMCKDHPEFFSSDATIVYDRCRNIMSDKKLPGIEFGMKAKSFEVKIHSSELDDFETWTVEVQMMQSEGVVISDISDMCNPNLAERNMESKRILEIITSQVLYKNWAEGGSVIVTGNKAYDLTTKKPLPHGCGAKYTMQGFQKSAKAISRGPNNKPGRGIAVGIDFKFGAFFEDLPMDEFLRKEFDRGFDLNVGLSQQQLKTIKEASKYVQDIVMKTTHVKGKTFMCRGFSMQKAVKDISFENDGKEISLINYYKQKYGVSIRYGNMPPLRDERGTLYPIDVCSVAPFQRVPIQKQNPKQMQSMIKDAAVPPSKRLEIQMNQIQRNNIAHNDTLKQLGIQLMDQVLVVDGRLLPLPTLLTGNARAGPGGTKANPVSDRGEYRMSIRDGNRFLVGGKCTKVALLVCCTRERDYNEDNIKKYWNMFIQAAGKLGVQIAGPAPAIYKSPSSEDDIIGLFNSWVQDWANAPDFVHSILPNNGGEGIHNMIKYQENQTGIITQNIRLQTAIKCLDGRSEGVLVNVLCKTNLKLGGVDSTIQFADNDITKKWFDKGTMICGLTTNNPPPQNAQQKRMGVPPTEPSVVALVARTGLNAFDYTGEHWFVSPNSDNLVDGLEDKMEEMTNRYFQTFKMPPLRVVFFRDGVSEGQFAHVVENEVPWIRKGLKAFATKIDPKRAANYNPKLTVVVVRKRHTERFFPADTKPGDNRKAPEQNIKPGTVVDTGIVHPTDWEFYINSHVALQGTAKPAKYNPVLDENNFTADEMQALCHSLCYGHQIINKAVSMPVPIFAAADMAKRGKNMFRAWQMSQGGSESELSENNTNETDFKTLSSKLSTSNNKTLMSRKFWA